MRLDRVKELKVICEAMSENAHMSVWVDGHEVKECDVRSRAGGGFELFIVSDEAKEAAKTSKTPVKTARGTRGFQWSGQGDD